MAPPYNINQEILDVLTTMNSNLDLIAGYLSTTLKDPFDSQGADAIPVIVIDQV